VPWFRVRSTSNPEYHFGSVAGRHVVLLFLGSAASPLSQGVLQQLLARSELFDDRRVSLFPVSIDPRDEALGRLTERLPGVRIFWDFDTSVSRTFGVAERTEAQAGSAAFLTCALLLDPSLRVMRWFLPESEERNFAPRLIHTLEHLPWPLEGPAQPQAPVLILPRVFEPDFCRHLIKVFESHGGRTRAT
jgi:hypothetical protein